MRGNNQARAIAIKKVEPHLKRTFMGFIFLTCGIEYFEYILKKMSCNKYLK